MTSATAPSRTRLAIAAWSQTDGSRYSLHVDVELRVGDLSGDLADRGFLTVEHEPCPPGCLTLSVTSDLLRNGRFDSCGSSLYDVPDGARWKPGWSPERYDRLVALGRRWHLNTMRAACAHMTPLDVGSTVYWPTLSGPLELFTITSYAPSRNAWFDPSTGEEIQRPSDAPRKTCWHCGHSESTAQFREVYDAVDHYGANRGLVCPRTGYRYGSSWLVEPLPPEILDEIADLTSGGETV